VTITAMQKLAAILSILMLTVSGSRAAVCRTECDRNEAKAAQPAPEEGRCHGGSPDGTKPQGCGDRFCHEDGWNSPAAFHLNTVWLPVLPMEWLSAGMEFAAGPALAGSEDIRPPGLSRHPALLSVVMTR